MIDLLKFRQACISVLLLDLLLRGDSRLFKLREQSPLLLAQTSGVGAYWGQDDDSDEECSQWYRGCPGKSSDIMNPADQTMSLHQAFIEVD